MLRVCSVVGLFGLFVGFLFLFLVLVLVFFLRGCAGVLFSSCFTSMYNGVFQAVFLKKEHHTCSLDLVGQNLAAEIPVQ